MAITVTRNIEAFHFAENTIDFRFRSDKYLLQAGQQGYFAVVFDQANPPQDQETISFSFLSKTLDFTFVSANPDQSGYQIKIEGNSLSEIVENFVTWFRTNVPLAEHFYIRWDDNWPHELHFFPHDLYSDRTLTTVGSVNHTLNTDNAPLFVQVNNNVFINITPIIIGLQGETRLNTITVQPNFDDEMKVNLSQFTKDFTNVFSAKDVAESPNILELDGSSSIFVFELQEFDKETGEAFAAYRTGLTRIVNGGLNQQDFSTHVVQANKLYPLSSVSEKSLQYGHADYIYVFVPNTTVALNIFIEHEYTLLDGSSGTHLSSSRVVLPFLAYAGRVCPQEIQTAIGATEEIIALKSRFVTKNIFPGSQVATGPWRTYNLVHHSSYRDKLVALNNNHHLPDFLSLNHSLFDFSFKVSGEEFTREVTQNVNKTTDWLQRQLYAIEIDDQVSVTLDLKTQEEAKNIKSLLAKGVFWLKDENDWFGFVIVPGSVKLYSEEQELSSISFKVKKSQIVYHG